MSVQGIGWWFGRLVASVQRSWTSGFLKRVAFAVVAIVLVPQVADYWLKRVPLPAVPASAIAAMLAASLLFMAFGFAIHAIIIAIQSVQVVNRQQGYYRPNGPRSAGSEGSFAPHTDEQAWTVEQLELLKAQGVINESDQTEIENLAREIGKKTMAQNRGRK